MNARARSNLRILGCGLALACAYLRGQDSAALAASRHAGVEAIYPVMMKALEAGDIEQARSLCEHAIRMEPRDPVHRYNLACIEARAGGPMLPRALALLDQAVQLGYNDRNQLQNDPDLAAIRGDPKFATILAKLDGAAKPPTLPGFEPAPAATKSTAPKIPGPTPAARPAAGAAATATAAVEKPAPNGNKDGIPVGLYFMVRYWFATRTLEKAAWYFAPDHTVYEQLETGFSKADLAAHRGHKGTAKLAGDSIEITWADGKKTSSKIEKDNDGVSFAWDMGIFTPTKPITNPADIAGTYEGGESVSFSGSNSSIAKGLELRADGTFTWSGVAAISSTNEESRITAGGSSATTGTWRAESYSLILTDDSAGKVFRGIAFPYDDDPTPGKNSTKRLFFAGTMYKKLK